MKTYLPLMILLLYTTNTLTGGVCSSGTKVKQCTKKYSFSSAEVHQSESAEDEIARRQKEINLAISKATLPAIYMMHVRMKTADFAEYDLTELETKMFRDAVAIRYNDNRDTINALVADSIEKHRNHTLKLAAREKMSNRRRRLAWRSEDSFKFNTGTLQAIAEVKEETKNPIP